MNISPLNNSTPLAFKGTIKVQTQDTRGGAVRTKYYYTNKKEDGEILSSAVHTLRENGFKSDIYGKDTQNFHKTLEKIIGAPIPQPSLGDKKSLIMGGFSDSDYYKPDQYTSSYNKIFYKDETMANPMSIVTVDLMQPEERLEAAKETMARIRNRVAQMTGTSQNTRLNPVLLDYTACKRSKYPELEEVLNKTLYYLDGNIGGADFVDKAPEFEDSQSAYNALVKSINNAAKINNLIYGFGPEENSKDISKEDMNNIRRAVYYLDAVKAANYLK